MWEVLVWLRKYRAIGGHGIPSSTEGISETKGTRSTVTSAKRWSAKGVRSLVCVLGTLSVTFWSLYLMLQSLLVSISLFFFPLLFFLHFPFFSKDFRDSTKRKKHLSFSGFPCLFFPPKSKGWRVRVSLMLLSVFCYFFFFAKLLLPDSFCGKVTLTLFRTARANMFVEHCHSTSFLVFLTYSSPQAWDPDRLIQGPNIWISPKIDKGRSK